MTNGTRRTLTRIAAAGAAVVAATALLTLPAAADVGVDQALEPGAEPTNWFCGACSFGQTFVPAAVSVTGIDLALTSTTSSIRYDTLEVTLRAGGPDGALLGTVSEYRGIGPASGADGWQHFDLAEPIAVTPGETYYVGFRSEGGKVAPIGTPSDVDRYATGTMFFFGGPTGGDLYFRTHGELDATGGAPSDADGDGVVDADDRCADTDPAAPTPPSWNKNRFWNDANGAFVDGKGMPSGITLADTGGCDGHQIIAAAGLGTGHAMHGLSRGELRDWVAQIAT